MLDLVGRWFGVSNMPKTDTHVNRHLMILPRLRDELLRELYCSVPETGVSQAAGVLKTKTTDPEQRDVVVCPSANLTVGLKGKGRGRLSQTPPRAPSR